MSVCLQGLYLRGLLKGCQPLSHESGLSCEHQVGKAWGRLQRGRESNGLAMLEKNNLSLSNMEMDLKHMD